jgi:hypothetical protein
MFTRRFSMSGSGITPYMHQTIKYISRNTATNFKLEFASKKGITYVVLLEYYA